MFRIRRLLAIPVLCCALLFSQARAFTIAWLSDTQNYHNAYKPIFDGMTQWIADNREALDIRFVFHTGDVVGSWSSKEQWLQARESMDILCGASIPFLAACGNHDIGYRMNYANFLKYLLSLRPAAMSQEYGDTGSRYELFSADGRDYIFMSIAFSNRGPGEDEINWINGVLRQFSGRDAIIITHSYIKKRASYTTQGKVIFERIVKANPNVFLVLCGHCRDISEKSVTLDDDGDGRPDRTVYAILSNFQGGRAGGGGYMRLLDFRESEIYLYTYSPYYDSYEYQRGETETTVPLPDKTIK